MPVEPVLSGLGAPNHEPNASESYETTLIATSRNKVPKILEILEIESNYHDNYFQSIILPEHNPPPNLYSEYGELVSIFLIFFHIGF